MELDKTAETKTQETNTKINQINKLENKIYELETRVDELRLDLAKSKTSLEVSEKQKEAIERELLSAEKANDDMDNKVREMEMIKDELNVSIYSYTPRTRTLGNSNSPLIRTKSGFPWICSKYLLSFNLNNSNPR